MTSFDWQAVIRRNLETGGRITALTGAGISAESGIPTFRGPEGYWTVGSRVYHPQEMATNAMFRRRPDAVWQWYLHRAAVCRRAAPNAGHAAIAAMDRLLGERFTLITQNVDNLHRRAGSPPERTYQIHGNVFQVRCAGACRPDLTPLPDNLVDRDREAPLTDAERALLTCRRCGDRLRPHVLWFDEVYDETWFRFHSSLAAAAATGLLLVVGTSGATIVDIDPAPNPFAELALRTPGGLFIQEPAARFLPELLGVMAGFRP